MFYRTTTGHPFPHSPFAAIVSPRPIAWISTRSSTGDNLAHYSFFNAIAYDPPQIMFSGDTLDTVTAIRETRHFAVNTVSRPLWHAMNETSAPFPRGTDEFIACGVEKAECQTINCPRVAEACATLECTATQILTLEGQDNTHIIARVEAIHIADNALTEGRFDVVKAQMMARLGYMDYLQVTDLIELKRPR